jgi:hypothetical protein
MGASTVSLQNYLKLIFTVKVTLRLAVRQYVLVSSTLVGLATRYYFLSECCCLKFAVFFLLGALSDERTGLQFAVSGSYFTTDAVSQSVCLGVGHPRGTCDRYYFLSECCCQKLAVLFLWGALSNERTGLSKTKLLYE